MLQNTSDPQAASRLFNLPQFQVADVSVDAEGGRTVMIGMEGAEAGCPTCGVVSTRVHQVTASRVRDVPIAGHVKVVWRKRRFRCGEAQCPRSTFTEQSEQIAPRARTTTRLRRCLVEGLACETRPVSGVAAAFGVSWPTVHRQIVTHANLVRDSWAREPHLVHHLGIDEHRFRSVRWFRDPTLPDGHQWRRLEPWSMTFTDLTTGRVLGVVPGRDGAALTRWLLEQPQWWCDGLEVIAIDPSAAFRSAIITNLPDAQITVDHFHLVKLANDMVTQVRRRVSWDRHDRRGRRIDAAWAHRGLLLRGYDTLSENGRARLDQVLRHDDPTDEIGAAWGVKEQLRRILACTDLDSAAVERTTFDEYVGWAAMAETTRLKRTIDRWWPHIETFILTRVTNAKTEAANTTIKHIKRTGRGYRNHDNYACRILITSAARTAT